MSIFETVAKAISTSIHGSDWQWKEYAPTAREAIEATFGDELKLLLADKVGRWSIFNGDDRGVTEQIASSLVEDVRIDILTDDHDDDV